MYTVVIYVCDLCNVAAFNVRHPNTNIDVRGDTEQPADVSVPSHCKGGRGESAMTVHTHVGGEATPFRRRTYLVNGVEDERIPPHDERTEHWSIREREGRLEGVHAVWRGHVDGNHAAHACEVAEIDEEVVHVHFAVEVRAQGY